MEIPLAGAAWVVAAAAALLATGVGGVLAYHWFRFAMNHVTTLLALGVYAGVCTLLLVQLFGAAVFV